MSAVELLRRSKGLTTSASEPEEDLREIPDVPSKGEVTLML